MKKIYCSENSASELFTLFDSTKYRKQDAYRNHTHTQIELGFVVEGAGNGHQLGMSQYGAYAMAEQGFTYDEIIKFYYTGVRVDGL